MKKIAKLLHNAKNPVELILKKRNGEILTQSDIEWFFSLYHQGNLPEYQMSAMLMAIYFNPLNAEELAALCHTMITSGHIVDLRAISKPKIDKHSTGGIGDKTSLILAPIAASLGIVVPMISGRGLGHTGGTLDKLESIPGFNVNLSLSEFKGQLQKVGCGLIGQTKEIAPLDKSLYALRDVTATVESIPLIAASIMSKKISSGLDGLVLDVKTGSGAFMKDLHQAKSLAKTLISIAISYEKSCCVFITDMNEPLGYAVGNWLEVQECIACLQGKQVPDLMEVSLTLSGAMVQLAGKCRTLEEGVALSREQIKNGEAWEKFLEIVQSQGGDTTMLQSPQNYPKSNHRLDVLASETGFMQTIDAQTVGFCAMQLGAGRQTIQDKIDPKAGIVFHKKCGDEVIKGEKILTIHTDKSDVVEQVSKRMESAFVISPKKVVAISKIIEKIPTNNEK